MYSGSVEWADILAVQGIAMSLGSKGVRLYPMDKLKEFEKKKIGLDEITNPSWYRSSRSPRI